MNKPQIVQTAHGRAVRLPIVNGKRTITAEWLAMVAPALNVKSFVKGIQEAK